MQALLDRVGLGALPAGLARSRHDPVVVQTLRATAGAVLAFVVARWLTGYSAPLLAPLTALLVVQVSLYATLTSGIRRINSVIAGVLIAALFSQLVDLDWWSLGLLILLSLVLGHLVRVDEFVPEVAISAMLVLGVSHVAQTAWGRVWETLIGAATGMLFNALFVPPVLVRPAGEAITDLAGRMRELLLRVGRELHGEVPPDRSGAWLREARTLDQDIVRVDAALSTAEDTLRCNPRVREGVLTRIVLRSGLDTLEISAVVLRTLCRSLTDLSQGRRGERLYPPDVAEGLERLLTHLADAVHSFAHLITAQVSANAEQAEEELTRALAAAREDRRAIAALLLAESERQPDRWQLHGALLANIDRLMSELDVEKRSAWLEEELDRYSERRRPRTPLDRFGMRVRTVCGKPWRR
ncbi:FUSC family protein [Streptomyces capparidis]